MLARNPESKKARYPAKYSAGSFKEAGNFLVMENAKMQFIILERKKIVPSRGEKKLQNTWLDQAFRLPGNPESAIDHNKVRVMKKS